MNRMSRLAGQLERGVGLNDEPHRTAAAIAVGAFLSFSPFLGLQIIAAFTCAHLFRLNRVAVFCGLNMNVPWIVVPWYVGTTWAAAAVLGVTPTLGDSTELQQLLSLSLWQMEFWQTLTAVMQGLLWPFLVGPTLGAAVVAGCTFWLARTYLARRSRARGAHQVH